MTNHAITPNPVLQGEPSTAELRTILQLQNQVLERVIQDTTCNQVLDDICHYIEQCVPDCVVSIMLLDKEQNCLNVKSAPSLPQDIRNKFNGLVPGVGAGSCGTSVFLEEPAFVANIAEDNRWENLQDLAQELNLAACWSYPVWVDTDDIAGSCAISSFQPRLPSPFHAQLLETAANLISITLRRSAFQEAIKHKESLLKDITQAMPGVVYQYRLLKDSVQSFTYLGPGIERICGISAEEALDDFSLVWKQVHPEDREGLWQSISALQNSSLRSAWSHEFRVVHKNGETLWIRGSALLNKADTAKERLWNGILLDITPEKASIEQLRLANIAFSSTNEGFLITDKNNRIIDVNRAYMDISGYNKDELLGQRPSILRSGHHGDEFYQTMWESLKKERHWQGEIWNRRKNGEVVPHWVNINAVHAPKTDELTHYISVHADISSIKASEEKLSYLTHHDALTHLPNRLLFGARLDHTLTHRAANKKVVMFHLDLDRFKHINDTLGHKYGDQLLLQVTDRLQQTIGPKDTLARVGGDEFAILVEGLEHVSDAASIADKIVEVLEQPFNFNGKDFFSTGSIGIALAPDHGNDIDTLTKHADIALNQAKDRGRNNYAFFQPELSETVEEWIKLEPELRRAVSDNQFQLYFQAQVDNTGSHIVGAEALIRWQHPTLGFIPPNQFLPIAEEIGLMSQIGDWVINTALQQLSEWYKKGLSDFKLAINLASEQITKQNLPQVISQAIDFYQVPAEMLELEILETFLMQHEEEATSTFYQLRDLNVNLALDDFGTGYSSLSYLKKLPITKVKIDRSLVSDIPKDTNDEAITKAVILLAHTLGLSVCAEGVETPAQRDFLEKENCDQLQGYLFNKPIAAEAFSALLHKHNKITS
ncbi:MAG: diguanylate cyclase [Neptuniibacter caesariensis]|uniref:cyclic-guanylate-specific phosphodiesterase n=1 Tax=Neptuniibacter caesariensis TaxID=207954 RepID=A0A2G6JNX1_NEPCE|nr:MAG: diguanylate cyclase [Neptuniibacter caesariensis]